MSNVLSGLTLLLGGLLAYGLSFQMDVVEDKSITGELKIEILRRWE